MTSDADNRGSAAGQPQLHEPNFTQRVITLVLSIPKGKAVSYGQIATMAGNPRGARQVVRALNSARGRDDIPWFRLVNRDGRIALPTGGGFELQRDLLRAEGLPVDDSGQIARDGLSVFEEFRWRG